MLCDGEEFSRAASESGAEKRRKGKVLIEARGLGKCYPREHDRRDGLRALLGKRSDQDCFWAARDVDLIVRRGETVGIVGCNGSGKSTLLHMLSGIVQPSAGSIAIKGRMAALLELGSGFNPEFTGRENVCLGAALLGLREDEIARRFAAIEAFAEIGPFMDQPMRQFSTGMQARLAFGVAAHVDADLLLVDEVLAVGDAAFQQKCMRFMRGFRRNGALIFVSHDLTAVRSLCDRVLWLDRGQVRAEGGPEQICRRYEFSHFNGGSPRQHASRAGGRGLIHEGSGPARYEPLVHGDADEVIHCRAENLPEAGGVALLSVGFLVDGKTLAAAEGGEEVALRILCRATRDLAIPVVAFSLRDRLGQILFGDDSSTSRSPERMPSDTRFAATFRFDLPHLPSGEYVVDAMVFEQAAGRTALLRRFPSALVLTVHSRHPSGGCVNLPPLIASLRIDTAVDAAANQPGL